MEKLLLAEDARARLMELGLVPKTRVVCVASSPAGDPRAFLIRGKVVALRRAYSRLIEVKEEGSKPKQGQGFFGRSKGGRASWCQTKCKRVSFGRSKGGRNRPVVALAGTPNVGKSSLFNRLTGLHQHTGNWPGKTVACARGNVCTKKGAYELVDLPGTYSLKASSCEEEIAGAFLKQGCADAVVVVCDATSLERSLNLLFQVMELEKNVILCLNLMDEARRKRIWIHQEKLAKELGIPVVGVSAHEKKSLSKLKDVLDQVLCGAIAPRPILPIWEEMEGEDVCEARIRYAERLCAETVVCTKPDPQRRDRLLDRCLTSRLFGYPLMLLLLALLFWLTMVGANVPSQYLSAWLFGLEEWLTEQFVWLQSPKWLHGVLILGMYRTMAWVVSVMLPPMAIFFPLFTLLEDMGLLPRIAFNLDHCFQKCKACGKQALTMAMGFGCNAVGVMGCRIIDSPRERMIAILTNSFVPCNGRFPTLILMLSLFFAAGGTIVPGNVSGALLFAAVILFAVGMTFFASYILSHTFLRGEPSGFVLELPPYRRPQVGQILLRSILDRTLFVLGRAAAVAAPAGALIWILANVTVGGETLLNGCTAFLDPFARLLGLDGVILMAFILGIPANEIVLPILLMTYLQQGQLMELTQLTELRTLLVANGWTPVTALCVMVFSLLHWPCSTTLLTIKKETGSVRFTVLAALLPTVFGMVCCGLIHAIGMRLGM